MIRRGMLVGLAVVLGLIISAPLTARAQVTSASLAADKPAPQAQFTTITFTATATGGTAPLSYKWWLSKNGGQTWMVVSGWGPGNTFMWGPTTASEHSMVGVWVRSAGNTADMWEAGGALPFPILSICAPTVKPTGPVPPDQDLQRGQCLFNSPIAFGQADPTNLFASCGGCHPGGGTDRGTHPVMITNGLGTFIGVRQVPNLRNATINVPLGWDGRHGGTPGDMASIQAAIASAAKGAINSPVEMGGKFNPGDPADQDKMTSLVAFLVSRSPTQPKVPGPNEQRPVLEADTAARVAAGAAVFFGRSASTQGLLAAGKACVSCHPPPAFTDNKIRSNILNPKATWDFGFPQAGGGTGPQDHGAGLVTVTDPVTGKSAQVGTFKTPSLHHFYPSGQPSLHNGIFAEDGRLFQFYQKSLGFKLAPGEATGLHYWLVNCPRGIGRPDSLTPVECF